MAKIDDSDFAGEWEGYIGKVYADGIDPFLLAHVKMAFVAGAVVAHQAIREAAGIESPAKAVEALNRLSFDIQMLVNEVKSSNPMNQ